MKKTDTDIDYFAIFSKAAELIFSIFDGKAEFAPPVQKLREIRSQIENMAANVIKRLQSDFIPPIERADIYAVMLALCELAERAVYLFDLFGRYNITRIRKDAVLLLKTVKESMSEICSLMSVFCDFKNFKRLNLYIAEISRIYDKTEKECSAAQKRLYCEAANPAQIYIWTEVYSAIEDCVYFCRKVAREVELSSIKNS